MNINKKDNGSFFSLLLKNYIVFTVATVILVLAVYFFVSVRISGVLKESNPEKLLKYQDYISEGDYDKIPVKRILGRAGYIEVLDEDLNIVYESKDVLNLDYTSESLKFVAELFVSPEGYPTVRDFNHMDYTLGENEKYTLVYVYQMSDHIYTENDFILLDGDSNIVSTSLNLDSDFISKTQFDFLTKRTPKDYNLYKYIFTGNDGETYTILLHFPYINALDFDKVSATIYFSFALFILLYIVIIIGFVYWLYKTVKKPIVLLNDAILDFSDGTLNKKLEYSGAREFVQICDSFSKMAERLEESERRRKNVEDSKQKMLADISHDLKTPITVIQGYSKAIFDGIVPEERKDQYLSTIYQKSFVLTELINKFYEFSKLEHPDFKIVGVKMDICECARAYLSAKYNEIDLAGFNLDVDIPEERLFCILDKLHLNRAFENILANSLKHNPAGTTLYFSVSKEDENAVVTIADNGVGIPKELVEHIFDAFVVGDDSRNNRQGSGLGLAITRKIAQVHDGNVSITYPPTPPYSTEFKISIPLCK